MELDKKITSSVKWASITEILAKLITPFTSMILARLLTPNEFGVVATITMITSFADIFSDAGFQKYLIQKPFDNNKELNESANVAFWTNLSISILLWLIITLFSEKIASMVGNPGLGNVISVASISLVLTSFSSIQMAIYKKKFDFKTLFIARIIGAFVPVFVTIPLALLGFSYWSIVIGTIATNLANAIILTVKSTWRPYLFYKFFILKKMFSFSMWTLLESILLWMTSYAGTFIVGRYLSSYYLGLYKNSISMVTSLMNIIAASTAPVLLSALSLVKSNRKQYENIFFGFQQKVSLLLIPLGTGVFLYRELATYILFGAQWSEASLFVGIYAVAQAVTILTGQYISLIFTSKERPKLSVISQVLQLMGLIPLLLLSVNRGFTCLIIARSVARALFGIINMLLVKVCLNISPARMIKNMIPAVVGSLVMVIITFILREVSTSLLWTLFTILLSCISYLIVMFIIPQTRVIGLQLVNKIWKMDY